MLSSPVPSMGIYVPGLDAACNRLHITLIRAHVPVLVLVVQFNTMSYNMIAIFFLTLCCLWPAPKSRPCKASNTGIRAANQRVVELVVAMKDPQAVHLVQDFHHVDFEAVHKHLSAKKKNGNHFARCHVSQGKIVKSIVPKVDKNRRFSKYDLGVLFTHCIYEYKNDKRYLDGDRNGQVYDSEQLPPALSAFTFLPHRTGKNDVHCSLQYISCSITESPKWDFR